MSSQCCVRLITIVLNENRHTPIKIFNFDTQVYNKFRANCIKTYLISKPKKGLVVSLRAPKHFKVGRQQYNTWNQLVRTTFAIDSNTYIVDYNNCSKFIASTNKAMIKNLPVTPLSSFTSVKITYQVNFKFNII